ncbi:PP2C family serine/threonine-protein phosphatase [Demequina sp. SYSU T00068]|nr:PP2C family serine/threonine-protein phosphatase [Demequina sp. SYSU T00068]MDN4489697.1 PP2C family serine/threonine-protein phosphatase [Demequina sp. SYSU T00068]
MSPAGNSNLRFREFHYQVRGRSHAADGTPCQDRTSYMSRQGVQVLCLSDGAGSAGYAAVGAQLAVSAGSAYLADHFKRFVECDDGATVAAELVGYLRERAAHAADRHRIDARDMAATFLAVATHDNRYFLAHLGDGVIGIQRNGRIEVASAPDNAEFANQTTFITSSDAASRIRLARGSLDGVTGFVLMSDGTGSSLYSWGSRTFAPACDKLLEHVASAPKFQVRNPTWEKQLRKFIGTRIRNATRDDCSIGILARKNA